MKLTPPDRRGNRSRIARRTVRLAVELLESRQLLAATLLDNGTWDIVGTSAADTIYVARDEYDPRWLIAEVNGRIEGEEYASDVSRIQVSVGDGNDWIEIDESAGALTLPVLLKGDDGNDTLVAGSGPAFLTGDNGNDQLIGGAANDLLFGGPGDDYLGGGLGVDLLDGGPGNNQLVPDAADQSVAARRVPAEWEQHDSTWLQWPKGEEVSQRSNVAGIIKALQAYERVNLVVESSRARTEAANFLRRRGVPLGNIQFHIMPYDWSWMRDNGAIWVKQTDSSGQTRLVVQDWGFDGWGGYGGPSRKDDAVPCRVASLKGVACESVPVVLEKGTLEFNGRGALITSWTVLHQRNPLLSREQLESVLKYKFGVNTVVWLEGVPSGDITEGHVDGIARFVDANTVVVGRYRDQSDPDAALFEQAATTIQAAGFTVVRMDIPGYVRYSGEWLPANYLNYLVANGVVIASSYANAEFDNYARQRLGQLFPGRQIILTDTRELWYNGGAVHCVTNDQPVL